jgi:hypothetical protein
LFRAVKFAYNYQSIMDTTNIIVSIAAMLLVGIIYYYFYQKEKKAMGTTVPVPNPPSQPASGTNQMQLAAYERLVILSERIAIPNLISRCNQPGLTKTDMQHLMTQTIKQEFEHNLTQQIYVTSESWEAVRTLKDQNIHLINQVAGVLPAEANGMDLSKKLLDFLMGQQQGNMHTLVQDALSHEAKKIMR